MSVDYLTLCVAVDDLTVTLDDLCVCVCVCVCVCMFVDDLTVCL